MDLYALTDFQDKLETQIIQCYLVDITMIIQYDKFLHFCTRNISQLQYHLDKEQKGIGNYLRA